MSTANNESCRVGLIALRDEAAELAARLRGRPEFELVAQAGVTRGECPAEVEWHDDPRGLLARGDLHGVLVALPVLRRGALLRAACERGAAVWVAPPLCATLSEGVELVRAAQAGGALLHASSWWRHVQPAFSDLLETHERFVPRLTEITVRTAGPPLGAWRNTRSEAGGGVLMYDAYRALEALIAIRGLPESVQAAVSAGPRRRIETPRDTEEVVSAVLRYGGGGLALLHATWDIPPLDERTIHYDRATTLVLSPGQVALLDEQGAPLVTEGLERDALTADLLRFAADLRAAPRGADAGPLLERHLAVTALLEAIYLSARTGQLESPAKFYEVLGRAEPKS